jgi:large conductance mechanosensitive channel
MSFAQEFMAFLNQYQVIGVAIGLIIAAKVNDLIGTIVEDVITPAVLSPLLKRLHLDKLEDLSWNGVLYGKALAKLVTFLVVGLLVFIVVKQLGVETK